MDILIFITLIISALICACQTDNNDDWVEEYENEEWENYRAELRRREEVQHRADVLRAKADKIEREEL